MPSWPAPLCLALLVLAGCAQKKSPAPVAKAPETMATMAAYVDTTIELSKLRFADGQISLNDRCPVRRGKLNRKMPPVYVNGRPVGFC